MPIYTNGSTFPIHKFNLLNNVTLFSNDDIDKFIYYQPLFDIRRDFLQLINNSEIKNQHLFEVVVTYSLRRVFENKRNNISKNLITSQSINNVDHFVFLINLKLNLKKIKHELELLSDNGITVNQNEFLCEIIRFTYKYLYIEFSKVIYCHSIGNFNIVMEFKKYHNKYIKYQEDIEKSNYKEIEYYSRENYINSYKESFKDCDMDSTISEILTYCDRKGMIKTLNDIIEKNISLDNNLTANKKNKLLLPFFKLITCNFFFRDLLDYDLFDPDLVTKFKKFRLNMK